MIPHRPDWERSLVSSRAVEQDDAQHTGLGDPTRWGAETTLTAASVGATVWSPQLLRVQAHDAYPRNWQITGTVQTAAALVSNIYAVQLVENTPVNWTAFLELEMGIGQAVVRHWVNLRGLISLALAPSLLPQARNFYYPVGGPDTFTLPWILPGGVVARSLAARIGVQLISAGESTLDTPQRFDIAASCSPFAVGHDL